MSAQARSLPDSDALWMPFTANRQFKAAPRLLVGASVTAPLIVEPAQSEQRFAAVAEALRGRA